MLLRTGWPRDGSVRSTLLAGPEPEATALRLARVLEAAPGLAAAGASDPAMALRLVAVCSSGRALPALAAGLGDAAADPLGSAASAPGEIVLDPSRPERSLRMAIASEILRVAARDLTREITMPAVGSALADLADAAARAVLAAIGADSGTTRLAVIALGKWGGRELNYASDIDLMFVHQGDADDAGAAARRFIDLMSERGTGGFAFRVDAGLRPEGSAGPLTRSLDSYRSYWERWAETWEFQALLKGRVAAGDAALGEEFLLTAEPFVHPDTLGSEAVRDIRAMKRRTERVAGDEEVKRGVGGIRDVEFAVQLLQLVHGRADPALRSANTLDALDRLGSGGYVAASDAADLGAAYRWLRDVEHRIQLSDLRQTHTLPGDGAGRQRLAATMGYRDDSSASARERFEADLRDRRATVRTIHERLFYRPLLEAVATASSHPRVDRQLTALGFTDSTAARAAVADLTSGLTRRSRLMSQLLPVLMEWLSAAPDPDLGLTQLRLLADDDGGGSALATALRDDPAAAERLCRILGTARTAGRLLDRIPAVLPRLGDDAALVAGPDPTALGIAATGRIAIRSEMPDRVASLHRFWAEHLVETIAADVAGLIGADGVGRRLAMVADAVVAAALRAAMEQTRAEGKPPPPMAVMAMGKWGGGELTYASDLDALVVFEATAATEDAAVRVTELLMSAFSTSTLGLPPPRLDLALRPEGAKGALARSLASYRAYWERWALTWEHQALLRARAAAGDPELAAAFLASATDRAYPEHLGEDRVREIRAMKARIEQERIPIGEDPDFHVKLGRGALADVEWVVQVLQMTHGRAHPQVRGPSTMAALEALAALDLLTAEDAAALGEAYRFCTAVRNRLWLRAGRVRDSLPTDPAEVGAVARSLGYDLAPRHALREEYRRVTRRARRVVDRVFYGR